MVSVAGAMIGGAEFLVGLFILKYRPGLNIRSKPTFRIAQSWGQVLIDDDAWCRGDDRMRAAAETWIILLSVFTS